jgi:L-amino acid N-acyltransferase
VSKDLTSSQSNLTFRLANDIDLEAIVHIWEENIHQTYAISKAELKPHKSQLIDLFQSREGYCNFWVAVDDATGRVVGWQSYFPIFTTPLKINTALESSTYIKATSHKSGLAYQLMRYAIGEISNSKFSYIYGFVNQSNIGAIKLVNKIGFEKIGLIPQTNTFPYHEPKILFIYNLKPWRR